MQHGFIESFNGRFRDELLNEVLISTLRFWRRPWRRRGARRMRPNLRRAKGASGHLHKNGIFAESLVLTFDQARAGCESGCFTREKFDNTLIGNDFVKNINFLERFARLARPEKCVE